MNSHLKRVLAAVPLLGVAMACAACQTVPAGQIQDGLSITETPQAISTIAWFPPTVVASPSILNAREPTPEMKPGVGDVLLRDDFTSDNAWETAVSDQGAVVVGGNRLTIAAQPGPAPVATFRTGMSFGDFYLEIMARPSLCRDGDGYGLLFRAPNHVAYYRFGVACNGTAAMDRVSLGTSHLLHSPSPSGDVPIGAPGEVRLGVWAVGSEYRFFLNGRYQFAANDRNYPAGAIGVFAQAAGDTPATVTFSDLTVYSVTYSGLPGVPTP